MAVTGWHVDQAIMSEDERLVIIRFGRDWDPDCMRQDEVLYRESLPSAFLCFC
jgi:U5 snRNP protein, DIM1 family